METKVDEGRHVDSLCSNPSFPLVVNVIFTSKEQTIKALEKAEEYAQSLDARIIIVAAQIVPYPAPLDQPPIPFQFMIEQFDGGIRNAGKTAFLPYLCRDQFEAYNRILDRNSPAVIGIKKRWWPTREERLVRKLQRAGFKVILVETE